MRNINLYLKLEDLILQNLYSPFNSNTAQTSFYCNVEILSENINFSNFELVFNTDINYRELQFRKWRVPSTRIYYTRLSSKYFSIEEVSYFNFSIILARKLNLEKPLSFWFNKVSSESLLYSCNNNKQIVKSPVDLNNSEEFVAYISKDKPIEVRIDSYLSDLIAREKEVNFTSKIHCYNQEFLEKLDVEWSSCTFFDQAGNIINDKDNDPKVTHLLLKELEIYSGIQYSIPQITTNNNSGNGFYHSLNDRNKIQSRSIKKELQSFWDEISQPCRKVFLSNYINERPEEAISFLLLVFLNGFWWAEISKLYFKQFLTMLSKDTLHLFNLVFELKSRVNVSSSNNIWLLNPATEETFFNLSFKGKRFFINQNYLKGNYTIGFKIGENGVLIDQKAQIEFDEVNNEFHIQPSIFNYHFQCEKCLIIIGSNKYLISLAWKRFTITLGKTRFKFLFKKNRYQISIKAPKWIEEIEINKKKISLKGSKYQKEYLEVETIKPLINVYFYDKMGRTKDITSTMKGVKNLGIHTLINNRYGHLLDNVHVKNEGSMKNTNTSALQINPDLVNIESPFSILNPKSDELKIVPEYQNRLLESLKYTAAEILENQIAVFVDDIVDKTLILDKFYSYFGIFVNMYSLDQLNKTFYKYNFIIADSNLIEGLIIFRGQFYNEIQIKKAGNKKIIQLEPENISEWFNNSFQWPKN